MVAILSIGSLSKTDWESQVKLIHRELYDTDEFQCSYENGFLLLEWHNIPSIKCIIFQAKNVLFYSVVIPTQYKLTKILQKLLCFLWFQHQRLNTSKDLSIPRSLKTQPIKGRLGEVFNHPDISSSRIDEVGNIFFFLHLKHSDKIFA